MPLRLLRIFAVAIASGALLVGELSDGRAGDVDADAIARIADASGPSELVRARKALVDRATPHQLQELKTDRHDAVALYAAWKDMVSRSKSATKEGRLEKVAVERFLGFVEGRLTVGVPKWWQDTLQSSLKVSDSVPRRFEAPEWSTTYRPAGIKLQHGDTDGWKLVDNKWKKVPSQKKELRAPTYAKLSLDQETLVIAVDGRSVMVPAALLEDESFDQLDVLLDGQRCYLALQQDWGVEFPLICYDEMQGVLWKTKVWSADAGACPIGLKGMFYQRVTLTDVKGRIIVWGAEPNAVFVEAFDKKTGRALFRFSTWYYDEMPKASETSPE